MENKNNNNLYKADSIEELNFDSSDQMKFDSKDIFETDTKEMLKVDSIEELEIYNTNSTINKEVVNVSKSTTNINNLDNELVHKNNNKNMIAIIIISVIIICIFGVLVFFLLDDYSKDNYIENEDIVDKVVVNNDDVKFDGQLYYDPIGNIHDIFNINIPSTFTDVLQGSNNVDVYIETIPNDYYSRCSVELKKVLDYTSASDLANGMAVYYDVVDTLTTKEINGIQWQYLKYEGYMNSEIYITEKDGSVYKYEYGYGKNANMDVCKLYRNTIINTVSFK